MSKSIAEEVLDYYIETWEKIVEERRVTYSEALAKYQALLQVRTAIQVKKEGGKPNAISE